jgi:hypothetical protein
MISNNILIKSIILLAKEANSRPTGIAPVTNPDIGFASVFLRLENLQEKQASLTINSVEIRNVSNGELQPFSHPPQEISLRPLENLEIDLRLTNKTGYTSGGNIFKAIVRYQIENQEYIKESQPVIINTL